MRMSSGPSSSVSTPSSSPASRLARLAACFSWRAFSRCRLANVSPLRAMSHHPHVAGLVTSAALGDLERHLLARVEPTAGPGDVRVVHEQVIAAGHGDEAVATSGVE